MWECSFFNNYVIMRAIIFIICLILAGCSSFFYHVTKIYKGPKRPASEVSVLTGIAPVFLWEIDGKNNYGSKLGFNCCDGINGSFVLAIEPGIHKLLAEYVKVEQYKYDRGDAYVYKTKKDHGILTELTFTFAPGKIYQLKASIDSAWIIEVTKLPKHRSDFY
jgi:hypothetical protein